MAKRSSAKRPTDILLEQNVIDAEALKTAEEEAMGSGITLEKYLVERSLVPPTAMTLALSQYLGMPPMSLQHFVPDAMVLELVPKELIKKHLVLPIARTGKCLTVALGDPFNIVAIDELHIQTGLEIIPVVCSEADFAKVVERTQAEQAASLDMEDIMSGGDAGIEMGGAGDDADQQTLEEMMEGAGDRPVIRMVNTLLIEAIRMGAMDIHIEPQEDFVRLRFRVDGVLLERPKLPKNLQNAITSRIKILADLDIGEQRVPQGGRFRIAALGKQIDVRVSILPTIFGGRVVLRLLDKNALFPSIAALGLGEKALAAMRYAIAQPHGIVLVTGPTGSGKTTTLYSCLMELNKPDVNITTCEDPVEYQIPGIVQVKINEEVGCTFAASLRAILRQDPDIVLIGEIRDSETCEIAIKAALTGHLVLSTLHANDASGTITRLLDMGMEPFLLASSVILTQGQRLYRRLCPACRKKMDPNKAKLKQYGIDENFFDGVQIYGPGGCPKCHSLGFKGRGAVMEVLPIDDVMRGEIMRNATSDELRAKAIEQGMESLVKAALDQVKLGATSLDMALKIAGGEH